MKGYWRYIIGALALVVIAANSRDVARYLKISAM